MPRYSDQEIEEFLEQKSEKKREIIQICSDMDFLHALCNDGSLWYMDTKNKWIRLPSISQTGYDNETS